MRSKYESFVVFYKGKKFDIADFIHKHPGGNDVLEPFKDKDITGAYDHIGHSEGALRIMNKRLIKDKDEVTASSEESSETRSQLSTDIEDDATLKRGKFVIKKLFTPEDRYNVHKILGFLSLANFIYRYCFVMPRTGSLGFGIDWFSFATLALHMFLSVSSFIFHVLSKRINDNALIIYEEYRIHAILFTLRGVIVSLIGLAADRYNIVKVYLSPILALTCLILHILVDLVTKKYGTPGVTAVRVEDKQTSFPIYYGKRLYSFYQFIALASNLSGDPNIRDLGFNILIAIQSSAFLMTLKRKNIIEWWTHAFFYTLCLILSATYIYIAKGPNWFFYVGIVFFGRVSFNLNKYVLWASYYFIVNKIASV